MSSVVVEMELRRQYTHVGKEAYSCYEADFDMEPRERRVVDLLECPSSSFVEIHRGRDHWVRERGRGRESGCISAGQRVQIREE